MWIWWKNTRENYAHFGILLTLRKGRWLFAATARDDQTDHGRVLQQTKEANDPS